MLVIAMKSQVAPPADPERIEAGDLDFLGDRFCELNIRYWTGCTFEKYLYQPAYWEAIAAACKWLARGRGNGQIPRLN